MGAFKVNQRLLDHVKDRVRKRVQKVSPRRLKVGLNAEAGGQKKVDYHGKEQDVTLAEVLSWMEHGTDTIPERPIMRQWFDANELRLRREMTAATRREYLGDKDAIKNLGAKWVDELREWYLTGSADVPELQTSTIGAKAAAGLSHPEIPVVATRQIVDALSYEERKR